MHTILRPFARIVSSAVVLLFCHFSLGAEPVQLDSRDALAALEKVVSRHRSLENFLKSKNSLQRYQEILTNYYTRRKFPCETFPEIISLLRRWIKEDPAIAVRLWAVNKQKSASWEGKSPVSKESFRFRLIPRLFHAIWDDLSEPTCSVDTCGRVTVATAGRWLAALNGTHVYHVDKDGAFTGYSLFVSDVTSGPHTFRLVATSDEALMKETRSFKKSLLSAWASGYKGTEPLVFFDGDEKLRGLSNFRKVEASAPPSFKDAAAGRLALIQPPRCTRSLASDEKSEPTQAPSPTNGTATVQNSQQSQKNEAVFRDVLGDLGIKPTTGTPAVKGAMIEGALRKVLKTSAVPRQRAEAALGLNLLNRGAGLGIPATPLSSPTLSSLSSSLGDTSPQVRAQSALALGDAINGGTGLGIGSTAGGSIGGGGFGSPGLAGPGIYGGYPGPGSRTFAGARAGAGTEQFQGQDFGFDQGAYNHALNEAIGNPGAGNIGGGSPNIDVATNPGSVGDRAFGDLLSKDGGEMDKGTMDKLAQDAEKAATPGERDKEIDKIVQNYLTRTKGLTANEAATHLEPLLQRYPPDKAALIAKGINQGVERACKECEEEGIIR